MLSYFLMEGSFYHDYGGYNFFEQDQTTGIVGQTALPMALLFTATNGDQGPEYEKGTGTAYARQRDSMMVKQFPGKGAMETAWWIGISYQNPTYAYERHYQGQRVSWQVRV
ncbi:hypothetical protein SLEP1_g29492 [Rubroshorea leprosula]|uniref:Uncharacterized protein n=1 Tax=Rubroshorea leprosula TaxID=152421 RepID=A0AAV5K5G8_9ROSI|nr:hypothetical protein SLEP1_g29492 [Rubroshorea leprosula]